MTCADASVHKQGSIHHPQLNGTHNVFSVLMIMQIWHVHRRHALITLTLDVQISRAVGCAQRAHWTKTTPFSTGKPGEKRTRPHNIQLVGWVSDERQHTQGLVRIRNSHRPIIYQHNAAGKNIYPSGEESSLRVELEALIHAYTRVHTYTSTHLDDACSG